MKYRKLGNTDIKVSEICLGTMNWGQQNSEKDAHEQMDYALAQGINFFDTAEIYPIPPTPETYGKTEEYIGTWFAKTKKRNQVFLASKAAGRAEDMPYVRPEGMALTLDRNNLRMAVEKSLIRLRTDRIDVYQLHWPDRVTNFFGKRGYQEKEIDKSIPIKETLAALKELINEGKIRYIGLSNETPWGVMQFIKYSESIGMPRVVSIQNAYSLVLREFEIGLAEMAIREKVGLLAYSPLAMGVLSGKYLSGKKPKKARFTLYERNSERYNPPQAQEAIRQYVKLAKKHKLDPAQMALAFVTSRPFVTSTIIGATTMSQLKSDIASAKIVLSEDVLNGIESIHANFPNPCS